MTHNTVSNYRVAMGTFANRPLRPALQAVNGQNRVVDIVNEAAVTIATITEEIHA